MLKWEDLPVDEISSEVELLLALVSNRGFADFQALLGLGFGLGLTGSITSPIFLILSIWIKLDSKGPVIYKQACVTVQPSVFKIWKFRTSDGCADKKGSVDTSERYCRITGWKFFIRRVLGDEPSQLVCP